MSPQEGVRELLEGLVDPAAFVLAPVSSSWAVDELGFAWHAARAGAQRAYEYWQCNPGARAYAVYRAAQDRADAAQDAFARWGSSPRIGGVNAQ